MNIPLKKPLQLLFLIILSFTITAGTFAQRPKVGLVLSGGGAKGFAHIGALKVLEEAGIPIDYIGGTSMGSIIGALYALGYPADSLESLVEKQDWAFLLTDRVDRKYLSFEEKEFDGKYFIPYPVNEGKLQMPSAVVSGQNLEMLLSRMMIQAQADTNFNNFPIPYFCVATDLEDGKAVVLKSGWPVTAIRASMSIPTVFCPIKINNKTYVDGGLYNNFPVEEMKSMGADIIIGVDVGFSPFYGDELNSMLRILEQSIFTHTIQQNSNSQKKCNVLIRPNLGSYNMMSFDATDTIIKLGQQAAMFHFEELRLLADSVKKLGSVTHYVLQEPVLKVKVDRIEVKGFQKIPRSYIESKVSLQPGELTIEEIEEGINRIYGTLLFKKASYNLSNQEDKIKLTIDVQERPQSVFSVGINYNTEYKASIYFNTSLYNIGIRGSKLSINALLGENPRINANYFIFSGWNPSGKSPFAGGWRFDFGINAGTNTYRLYYYHNGQRIYSNRYNDIAVDLYAQTVFKNSYAWGIGVLNEFTSKTPDINPFENIGSTTKLLIFHSYLKFDTYNRTYFPTEGIKLDVKARYLTKTYDSKIAPGIMISGSYGIAHSLRKQITLFGGLSSGISFTDSVPENYLYRLGGLSTHYTKNSYPFVGAKSLEISSTQFILGNIGVQFELFPKHFITGKANVYNISKKPIELFKGESIYDGYSIGYGYNSVLGPAELTVMYSEKHNTLLFLNLGFWF